LISNLSSFEEIGKRELEKERGKVCVREIRLEQCFSTFFPRGTLGYLYQYLAAPLDAKIGLKAYKSDNWRHP